MNKEIEIEYKSLITREKHEELTAYFEKIATKKPLYQQTNYYFDDENLSLNARGITLRIRYKQGVWEQTIKIPSTKKHTLYSVSTELNEVLTEEEALHFIQNGFNKEHPFLIHLELNKNQQQELPYRCLGNLITERQDFTFYCDTISIDKNFYNDVIDYEIEWETTNHTFVEHTLTALETTPNNGKGKRKRFLKTKK